MTQIDRHIATHADLLPDPSPLSDRHMETMHELTAAALSSLSVEPRGEQPDSPALPADGALRGDVPLSEPGKERI
jgi:hypothetical protein